MRLSQLKYLVELKKNRTISETAKKLYISQPSLSTAIKELEDELGFEIIERSNKGVVFTRRGELVLKYSRDVMQSVTNIERLGIKHEHAHKGYLSVASVYYVFQSIIMEAFWALKEQYPEVVASVREENSYDIVNMMVDKEIDVGIVMISNLEELNVLQNLEKHNLEFHKIMDEQMYFVVGSKNPLYGQEYAAMQELLQYPFLTRRKMLNQFNENVLLGYNKDLEFIQIDESESFLRYLANSKAVTVMPGCSVRQSVQEAGLDLHIVQVREFNWTSKIGWIFPKDEPFSAEEETFVGLLEENGMKFSIM